MKVVRKLLLVALILYSNVLVANPNYRGNRWEYDSYVGAGYKQYWIRAKDDWKRLFTGNTPGFTVFAGWRFHPYFGTEIGYEWTTDKPRSMIWQNNESFLNLTNTSGNPIYMDGKVRLKSGYIDLNMFIPIALAEDMTPEGIFSVGVAAVKPILKIIPTQGYNNNAVAGQLVRDIQTVEGKNKAIWRVGFGLQTLLFGDVGARLFWRFEKTSMLRLRHGPIAEDARTRVMFNNGQSLTLTVFKRV